MGKSESTNMRVAMSATRNLYPYLLPAITSLLEHNKVDKIYLAIEDDNLPYEVPKECECINVSSYKEKFAGGANERSQFTWMAMVRALYPTILPQESKIIQMDVDLVVTDSIQPLWEIDMTGKLFAAAVEKNGNYNPWGNEKYYNTGVAVLNLAEMRKTKYSKKALEMLNTRYMMCVDQDTLNYFSDKAIEIPSRYNECLVTETSDNPAVVHFAGYGTWWVPMVMPGHHYLDKYRHLFKEA